MCFIVFRALCKEQVLGVKEQVWGVINLLELSIFFVHLLSMGETAMNKTDTVPEPMGIINYKEV